MLASAATMPRLSRRALLLAGLAQLAAASAAAQTTEGAALDPDNEGAIVWQYRAGRGGLLGGIEWGSAVDGERAYFAVSDVTHPQPGGLHAVTLATGTAAWAAAPPALACAAGRGCSAAQSSALTVIPGAVFSGSFDGALRAYSAAIGDVIWSFDSNRTFTTVNSVPAAGASIGGPGPAIAGGMVFVNSGYGAFRAARATCCWRSASIRAGRAGKAGRVGRELLAALEAPEAPTLPTSPALLQRASAARAPLRMLRIELFPSWHAYSNIASGCGVSSRAAVQLRDHVCGSSTETS